MKIDLHIHTKTCSDGALSIEEVFREAKKRKIDFMSITDHDSIDCQERAIVLAKEYGINYVSGVELNVAFQCNEVKKRDNSHRGQQAKNPTPVRSVSLDFLGYQYDIGNQELKSKLELIREHRETEY